MTDKRAPGYSVETLREMLWYLPDTGQFIWKIKRGSTKENAPAGTWNRKVKYITLLKSQFKAADIANYLVTGRWQEMRHKDGNTKNNRWGNLEPSKSLPEIECPVQKFLTCYKTADGWQIASDLPKHFLDILRSKLEGF